MLEDGGILRIRKGVNELDFELVFGGVFFVLGGLVVERSLLVEGDVEYF